MDPIDSFQRKFDELRLQNRSFAVATVIDTEGSASARTGSRAIFDQEGTNLIGWIGGGCAERFIGEESVLTIEEKKARIITANMDDEVFGLGINCGGKMKIFIQPFFPIENITIPRFSKLQNEAETLASCYGWRLQWETREVEVDHLARIFLILAETISRKRNTTFRSMRYDKNLPVRWLPSFRENLNTKIGDHKVLIFGRSRITEALSRHFNFLDMQVRVAGLEINEKNYPEKVKCICLHESYDQINIEENESVIIASHSPQDSALVKKALQARSPYIGMVGSRVRALEVLRFLDIPENAIMSQPLFIPAGLNIGATQPEEIALSIITEFLQVIGWPSND